MPLVKVGRQVHFTILYGVIFFPILLGACLVYDNNDDTGLYSLSGIPSPWGIFTFVSTPWFS